MLESGQVSVHLDKMQHGVCHPIRYLCNRAQWHDPPRPPPPRQPTASAAGPSTPIKRPSPPRRPRAGRLDSLPPEPFQPRTPSKARQLGQVGGDRRPTLGKPGRVAVGFHRNQHGERPIHPKSCGQKRIEGPIREARASTRLGGAPAFGGRERRRRFRRSDSPPAGAPGRLGRGSTRAGRRGASESSAASGRCEGARNAATGP